MNPLVGSPSGRTQIGSESEAKNLQDVYFYHCQQLHCHPNSSFVLTLPSTETVNVKPADEEMERESKVVEVDISKNFVGRVGAKAIIEVAKYCIGIRRLCLADNFLNNESVKHLSLLMLNKAGASQPALPGLEHLDLSRNPISHASGKELNELAATRPLLHTIKLENTLINPALIKIIEGKAEANREQLLRKGHGFYTPASESTSGYGLALKAEPTEPPEEEAQQRREEDGEGGGPTVLEREGSGSSGGFDPGLGPPGQGGAQEGAGEEDPSGQRREEEGSAADKPSQFKLLEALFTVELASGRVGLDPLRAAARMIVPERELLSGGFRALLDATAEAEPGSLLGGVGVLGQIWEEAGKS